MRENFNNSAENPILTKSFEFSKSFPNLVQAFSTRKGGFSRKPFQGLNLGKHTPDNLELVQINRDAFFGYLRISEKQAVFPGQIHSDIINIVSAPGTAENCDALITDTKDLFLTIQTADCFPVFLFDPVKQAVGVIHSGWRGTAKNIAGRTIEVMRKEFSCSPEHILAGLGPGIQQDCYQVDKGTADFFEKEFLKPDGPHHFKLDVQGAVIKQLLEAGIVRKNLEIENTCTHCADDLYYSYRRDGQNSGRMMGVIGIRTDSP